MTEIFSKRTLKPFVVHRRAPPQDLFWTYLPTEIRQETHVRKRHRMCFRDNEPNREILKTFFFLLNRENSWKLSKLERLGMWSKVWSVIQTLRGSFSAVSKPIFATKYSLESSWRDLSDWYSFAPLHSQNFSKLSSNCLQILQTFPRKGPKLAKVCSFKWDFHRDFRRFSWKFLGR